MTKHVVAQSQVALACDSLDIRKKFCTANRLEFARNSSSGCEVPIFASENEVGHPGRQVVNPEQLVAPAGRGCLDVWQPTS
jgi:hypothetical protein